MPPRFLKPPAKNDWRTPDQIWEHYQIERQLAERLKHSTRQERTGLYRSVYDELFARVPHHPQLAQKASPEETQAALAWQTALLNRFLQPEQTFLEVGPGDCALSFEISRHVRQVYAADVSEVVSQSMTTPSNFKLLLFDGLNLPLPAASVDLAYSNQVIEHLHPDDAMDQLRGVHAVLKPGGRFVCVTPNRIGGPWDVSACFDRTCHGLHLKEYTYRELVPLLGRIGFRKVESYVGGRGRYLRFPLSLILLLETALGALPWGLQSRLARSLAGRVFLGLRLAATK